MRIHIIFKIRVCVSRWKSQEKAKTTPGSPTMSEKLVSLHLLISLQSQIGPLLMALRQQPIASSDNDGSVWAGVEDVTDVTDLTGLAEYLKPEPR